MKAISNIKQQGNILVMFTIGLFSLLAMAALALDGGHLILNNNRLQNYVDAAALSAAVVIDEGGTQQEARQAAVDVLRLNLAHSDAREILADFDLSSPTVSANDVTAELNIAFSLLPEPFISNSSGKFVKIEAKNIDLSNFLAQILNFNKRISASAVAGASTPIEFCFHDIVPMMVCGDPDAATTENPLGITPDSLHIMKIDAQPDSPIGPGNFQLIRLGDAHGAAEIRTAMAGGDENGSQFCLSSSGGEVDSDADIPTEPGNTVGPVAQGLNTRFGNYQGPMHGTEDEYPSDTNIYQGCRIELDDEGLAYVSGGPGGSEPPIYQTIPPEGGTDAIENSLFYDQIYRYDEYNNRLAPKDTACNGVAPAVPAIQNERRVMRVVVGDCTGEANGANTVDVMGVGCFFLTQDVSKKGNDSYVVGEFIENCTGSGWPSGNINADGDHTLVLYHVPGSSKS